MRGWVDGISHYGSPLALGLEVAASYMCCIKIGNTGHQGCDGCQAIRVDVDKFAEYSYDQVLCL
jgi:hypothetical protein